MLPDFPELKRVVLDEAYNTMKRILHERHPILAEIKSYTQHEGRAMRYEQVGYGEKQEDLEAHSFPIEINFDEVPTLIGERLTEKMAKLAGRRTTDENPLHQARRSDPDDWKSLRRSRQAYEWGTTSSNDRDVADRL